MRFFIDCTVNRTSGCVMLCVCDYIFRAVVLSEWFEQHNSHSNQIVWASKSPDLNPAEELWTFCTEFSISTTPNSRNIFGIMMPRCTLSPNLKGILGFPLKEAGVSTSLQNWGKDRTGETLQQEFEQSVKEA